MWGGWSFCGKETLRGLTVLFVFIAFHKAFDDNCTRSLQLQRLWLLSLRPVSVGGVIGKAFKASRVCCV